MQRARRGVMWALLIGAAVASGWVAAMTLAPQTSASGSRTVVDEAVSQLLNTKQRRKLNAGERERLLKRLLLLDRLEDAKLLVQEWLNQQPHSLPLGLLMADLHRRSGALEAARRELEQLLRLHPSNQELLQLAVLVDLQDGRGQNALQRLTARFTAQPEGQRLELGLLLADLQRHLGRSKAAAEVYQQLASESTDDISAVIALAMLHQEQGDAAEVEQWLDQARLRRGNDDRPDPMIDELAYRWQLRAARVRAGRPSPSIPPLTP